MSAAKGWTADLKRSGIRGVGSPGSPCQKQVTWAREYVRLRTARSLKIRLVSPASDKAASARGPNGVKFAAGHEFVGGEEPYSGAAGQIAGARPGEELFVLAMATIVKTRPRMEFPRRRLHHVDGITTMQSTALFGLDRGFEGVDARIKSGQSHLQVAMQCRRATSPCQQGRCCPGSTRSAAESSVPGVR